MKKLLLIFIPLILALSVFALSSNKAVILEHKTEVTGADSQGRAVSGHVDNNPVTYPSESKESLSMELNGQKKNTLTK